MNDGDAVLTVLSGDVRAMARELRDDRAAFLAEVTEALAAMRTGTSPLGADTRNLPARQAMLRFHEARDDAERLVRQVLGSFDGMAHGAQALIDEFHGHDTTHARGLAAAPGRFASEATADGSRDHG